MQKEIMIRYSVRWFVKDTDEMMGEKDLPQWAIDALWSAYEYVPVDMPVDRVMIGTLGVLESEFDKYDFVIHYERP